MTVVRTSYENGTPDCFYRDSDHSYWRNSDGTKCSGRLYSPSSISKMADKGCDGLGIWMERQGAYALRDEIVDTIDGVGEPGAISDALAWLDDDAHLNSILAERGWRSSRERSGQIGNVAHTAFEDALRDGRPVEPESAPEPEIAGLLTAVKGFLDTYRPTPIAVEQIVWSPTYNYAGRFDALIEVDGETWLVDLKTSKNVVTNVSFHVQLAGYAIAATECGLVEPDAIDRKALIQVRRDGTFDVWDGRANRADFLSALDLFQRANNVQRLTRKDERSNQRKENDD